MRRLAEKIAIVTGGARGIGSGITRSFSAEGASVIVAQRNLEDIDELDGVHYIRTDLGHGEQIRALVAQVAERFGGVDILVNNAGLMFERHVTQMTEQEWDAMLAVNLKAPFLLTKFVAPLMKARGGGSIINIGSIEGLAANPGHTAYSAAKSGIHGMTRALAVDLGEDHIRVNAIAPGWIETDLVREYISGIEDQEAFARSLKALHPTGRIGRIEDVAKAAVFLASEDADFITGQILVVDGGRMAQLPLPESLRGH